MSLFGAGWTLGSIAAMAAGGAESATYYETTGWRGVMESEQGSPVPGKFMSRPGGLYPLYYVFAAIGPFAGGQVLTSHATDGLHVAGLALEKDGSRRVLLANLTPVAQQVEVGGLSGKMQVRCLDETNAEAAMLDPAVIDLAAWQVDDGERLTLDLLPYAVCCIDGAK